MNTPSHAVLSLLAVGKKENPHWIFPAILGAVLPDLPMIFFYPLLLIMGYSETYIWGTAYYQEGWQAFFDIFNSLPLMLLGLAIAYYYKNSWFMVLFISMSLHVLGDLPLHVDDGHRHFYPLSTWRFESPVSYWDPAHYGNIVMPLEILFVLVSSIYMIRQRKSKPLNIALGAILGIYFIYFVFAAVRWGGLA